MKYLAGFPALWIAALVAVAGSAYGQQPPDVVQSDEYSNTAMGSQALQSVTPNSCLYCGIENTAAGASAMQSNTSGGGNVAMGFLAMQFNISGHNNTGVGDSALQDNTSGYYNTAFGSGALLRNTTAYNNTGLGLDALIYNTTGGDNTATGANALFSNTTAGENTATGYEALYFNTTGANNAATGAESLFSNTSGNVNTALGFAALFSNTTGSNNIALGTNAGYNLTQGSNNIDVGNQGVAGESGIIRIGTATNQTAVYIAGIENAKVTGSPVYVTANGQLGVLASSERYKTKVAPMGAGTQKLGKLRPVSFHLKTEPGGPLQYGLIAEEVDKVYPELVIRDEAGKIQGVRYDELAPMLLNEVQKMAAEIRELKRTQQQLQAASSVQPPKDELVAQR